MLFLSAEKISYNDNKYTYDVSRSSTKQGY